MAASGMTEHHRLCVMQFPSLTETAWTDAIRRRAADIGWSVHDLAIQEDWPHEPLSGSAVFLTTGLHEAEKLDPTHWIILAEAPSTSASVISTALGTDLFAQSSIVHTSIRLAMSAQVAARETDVTVLDAGADRLQLPGFGLVERMPELAMSTVQTPCGPLDIFKTLPIPIGASVDWNPEIFTYPVGQAMEGGAPDIDLTGRARFLMFGPFFYLPEGSWSVEIDVSIDPQTSVVALMFEWGSGDQYVSHTTSVTTPGQYRITLNRRWDVLEQAQFRLWLDQPLFQGRLQFNGCRVTRAPESTPQTSTVEERAEKTAEKLATEGAL